MKPLHSTPNQAAVARIAPAPAPKPKRMTAANITRGRLPAPWWILLYGEPKIGKTTFAAGAPSPVFITLDGGTTELDVARYPRPESFDEFREALDDVATNGIANGFRTLIIDPLAHVEPLIAQKITEGKQVNTRTWGGGYGAYDNAVRDHVRLIFSDLERIRDVGINIMLIGHSRVKKFTNPEGADFDVYDLDCESKEMNSKAFQLSTAVLFARREVFAKPDETSKKAKAYGAAGHMLYTASSAAFRAGNRWGLPAVMPLSWSLFASAMARGEERIEELKASIEAGLAELNDAEATAKVRAWLADGADLADVANVIASKLKEVRETQEGDEK